MVEKLLAFKYVSRVDTTDLNLDREEETSDEDAVNMIEYDVPQEEAEETKMEDARMEAIQEGLSSETAAPRSGQDAAANDGMSNSRTKG